MKVLLLTRVDGVGTEGELHEVADGFARNFLFPKHLAVPATDSAQREAAARAFTRQHDAERELRQLQQLAEALDGYDLTVTIPATEGGTLYGGVGVPAIVEALRQQGYAVDPSWVQLEQPFKEIGEHTVRLLLPHGLEVEVTVIVEAKDQ